MIVMIAMLATCATRKQECAVQTFVSMKSKSAHFLRESFNVMLTLIFIQAARIALGVWRDIRVAMALAT